MSKGFLPSYTATPMEGVFYLDILLSWEKAPGPQEGQTLPLPLFRMLHFLLRPWDLSGWPQWLWLLQGTPSKKKAELGKCLCLSFLFLTLMCKKDFGTAHQANLGTVHLWLCQSTPKGNFPYALVVLLHIKNGPYSCLLCTQEILVC